MGHSPVVANNGREALDHLARESFDLVLMDIQMPEMDGIATTRRIRENELLTHAHLPIIAMTGPRPLKGDRERCLAAGMDGYVTKPINAFDLRDAIATLMQPGSQSSYPDKALHGSADDPLPNTSRWNRSETLDNLGGDPNHASRGNRDLLRTGASAHGLPAHGHGAARPADRSKPWPTASRENSATSAFLTPTSLARQLEEAGRNSDLQTAARLLPQFEAELNNLLRSHDSQYHQPPLPNRSTLTRTRSIHEPSPSSPLPSRLVWIGRRKHVTASWLRKTTPMLRKILQSWLESWGYQVTVAEDGAKAWQAILQEEPAPQLLILDWMMPTMGRPGAVPLDPEAGTRDHISTSCW